MMNKLYLLVAAFITLLVSCNEKPLEDRFSSTNTVDKVGTTFIPNNAIEGELLVKFTADMTSCLDALVSEQASRSGNSNLDNLFTDIKVNSLKRVFPVRAPLFSLQLKHCLDLNTLRRFSAIAH